MSFGHLLTAMVTPFNDQGEVCEKRTASLIDHLLNTGTEGLVVAGTTGESPTLSKEEKLTLFQYVVKKVNGRIPVIAGTGSNDTQETIQLSKEAEKTGVDGIMLVVPYYNKPNQKGLYEHFKAVADAVSLPVMIYNIPGRSVVNMNADTIVKLGEIDNVVAVKEASGDLNQVTEVIDRTADDFMVYTGEDHLTMPTLAIGGDGVISVASHIIGSEMSDMVKAYLQGDVKQAAKQHQKVLPTMRALFAHPSPVPVKTVLNQTGINVGRVRLPLVPLADEEMRQLMMIYHELKA